MPVVARQPGEAPLPLYYVLLPLAALALSLATYASARVDMLRLAVLGSAAVGAVLLLRDAWLMWRTGAGVGRLTLNLGVFYWFWLGAVEMALVAPAFPTPDPIYPGFRDVVPDRVVSIALICANLFALTTQLGWRYVPQPRRLLRALADRFDPRSSAWLDLLAFGMAALAWLPIMLAYEWNLNTALHDLLLMRTEGQVGPTQDVGLAHHLHLIGLFGSAFAVARIVFHVRGIRWLRYLAVVITVPIAYFGLASRFNFGFMVLPAVLMLGAPLSHHVEWKKRRRVLVVMLVSIVLLVLYQGAIRFTGIGGDEVRQGSLAQTLRTGYFGHDQFGPMLIAINLVDEQGFYFMEPMTPFFFTQFIPRASWPDKPDPHSWVTYNEAWTQGHDFNVTPSIAGQYYMNWGYFGVVWIGLFIGWLARFCEAWFSRLHVEQQLLSATVAGLLLAFVFFSFRIYHPMYFAYPLFGYLTYRLVTYRRPAGAAAS